VAVTALVAVASLALSPRVSTLGSFYKGHAISGGTPGIFSLSLSLVTTWIFARSIMNAAILGYFYGIAGALAYATYYLSFLTGAWVIASLRWRHGFDSIQAFLADRFGSVGPISYSFVTGLRLLSEVFANLLVIGIIFGPAGSSAYVMSIIAVGLVVLAYSALGGLHASIRTDVFQMIVFMVVLGVLITCALDKGSFDFSAIAASSPDATGPGWVLLAVAFLQVWSYPMHDPVMMDRGLISDKKSTMASFYHAAWLSVLCIMAFGLLGTYAGLEKIAGESFVPTLMRLFGEFPVLLFNVALIISCMSTLDSTLASAAKLSIVDMNMAKPTVFKGRVAMALFLLGGLIMVFIGSKDLFSAVAVSGTASMFLAPVAFFSLWGGRKDVPAWSYMLAFVTAMTGAVIYFLEAGSHTMLMTHITGLEHKYSKLLVISATVMVLGCLYFAAGILFERQRAKR
jgi:Na+/proline symporter